MDFEVSSVLDKDSYNSFSLSWPLEDLELFRAISVKSFVGER